MITTALPSTSEAIEFLQDLRWELRFSDVLDEHIKEPVKFAVRGADSPKSQPNPSKGTACWSFRGKDPGVHLIHFCLTLFKRILPGADWKEYLAAYAHHELLHACLTNRNLNATSVKLASAGVPFTEYNLFEDARIECLGRQKFGFPMAWAKFEAIAPASGPRHYFLNLIQNGGTHSADLVTAKVASEPWIERVRDYYFTKAIQAHDFDDMVALLQDWVREFAPPSSKDKNKTYRHGDIESGMLLQSPDFDALCDLASIQSGDREKPAYLPVETAGPTPGQIKAVPFGENSDAEVLSSLAVRTLNHELGKQAAERLSSLLAPSHRRERSVYASKRISPRAFASGRPDFYRRSVDAAKIRPIKIAFFIDCSGSMEGTGVDGIPVIDGGISIAMGLNILARRGLVSGQVILHKGDHTQALCSAHSLPLPDDFFARIPSDGHWEGLEPAFKRTMALTRSADYVFCYTDGNICDEPVDVAALSKRGVSPIGLYCGPHDKVAELKKWFSRVIVRDTVMDLLEALVATVDFSRTRRGG